MFQGTDDQARQLIEDRFPAYQPWVESIFSPSDGTEQMLFFVQTLLGLFIFTYCMYRLGVFRRNSRL